MTLNDLLVQAYLWCRDNASLILLGSVLLPLLGTLLARIGKGGKTDADGRLIASVVVAIALVAVLLEISCLLIARSLLDASLLDAPVALLIAPIVCLAGSLLGIRLVFPLNQLGSIRTMKDAGAFLAACLAVLWLLSTFRGWGIVFFGSLTQLVVIGLLGFFFLRYLYRRAFGLERRPGTRPRP
jgi:hypothetical protein